MHLVKAGEPVAVDCEGCILGANTGNASRGVGRVSIVNMQGQLIYDTFVSYPKDMLQRPDPQRYHFGVTYKDIRRDYGAQAHVHVLRVCTSIFDKATIVVGHSIYNDMKMLVGINFWKYTLYDTQNFAGYQQYSLSRNGSPSLSALASSVLGKEIQVTEHSSVEDAKVTMELYVRRKDQFQREPTPLELDYYDVIPPAVVAPPATPQPVATQGDQIEAVVARVSGLELDDEVGQVDVGIDDEEDEEGEVETWG